MATQDLYNAESGNTVISHGSALVEAYPTGVKATDVREYNLPLFAAISGKYATRFDDYSYY